MTKRFCAMLLAMCMTLSLLPFGARASVVLDSGDCGENMTWTLDSDGVLTISGTGAMQHYSIDESNPDGVQRPYPVDQIRGLVIEDGITSIGRYAFSGCVNLADVSFPATLKKISAFAFQDCTGLSEIVLPSALTNVEDGAFSGCANLETVTVADDADQASDYYWIPSVSDGSLVYRDASYTNVQGLCTDREGAVFVACREGGTGAKYDASPTMLRKFDTSGTLIAANNGACYCHANGMTYCPDDGMLYIATLGNATNLTDPEAITDPQNENVIGVVNGETLELERYISVRDQMRTIGSVYRSSKYTDARISAVHYDAYEDQFICLLSPYYSDNTMQQKYRGFAFFDRDWNLTKYVPIEDYGVISIIVGCVTSDAQYLYLCANVSGTQNRVFVYDRDCNYIGVWKLNSLTTAEFECIDFLGTTLYASINTNPITVEAYAIDALQPVPVSTVLEQGHRLNIGDTPLTGTFGSAFTNCPRLTRVAIPEGVTKIGENCFSGCSGLAQVMLPGSLMEIGDGAFQDCVNLGEVCYPGTREQWDRLAIAAQNEPLTQAKVFYLPYDPVEIAEHPADFIGGEDDTAAFAVQALGDVLSFQWEFSEDGGETWQETDCTADTIDVPMHTAYDGRLYRCNVEGAYGNTAMSDPAQLIVAPIILSQPTDVRGAAYDNASFHVDASGEDLIYRWYYSDDEGQTWSLDTSDTDTANCYMRPAYDGRLYRCVISDSEGRTHTSNPARLTIDPEQVLVGALGEHMTWTLDYDGCLTIRGDGPMDADAEQIAALPFETSDIRSLIIDQGVTSVAQSAFSGFENLSAVTLPRSMQSVEADAFAGCNAIASLDYLGSDMAWNSVVIESGNDALLTAARQYALQLLKQPEPFSVIDSGEATYVVEAVGTGLSYQWQVLTPEGSWEVCGAGTQGADSAMLTVTETDGRSGWRYRCVVMDEAGNVSVSDDALLSVLRIVSQPEDAAIFGSNTARFYTEATGASLTYQWQAKTPDGDWTDCAAETDAFHADTLLVQGVTEEMNHNGVQYRCIVTDCNGASLISDPATLTVLAPIILDDPVNAEIIAGEAISFQIQADGNGLTYQWQYLKPGRAWTDCSESTQGYHGDTLTVASVSGNTNRNGYQYRCVVTDDSGLSTVSAAAALKVLAPSVTLHPQDAAIHGSESAVFTVAVSGAEQTYQWQYRTPTGTWKNCSAATTGYQSDTLTVQGVTGKTNRDGYQYRCVISVGNCYTVTSGAATLNVIPPRILDHPQDVSLTAGEQAVFKVQAEGVGLAYQWQYQKPDGKWTDCTEATQGYRDDTLTVASVSGKINRSGYQYRCVVTDDSGLSVISAAAALNVSAPSITLHPQDAAIHGSENAVFTVTTSGAGQTYQWQYRTPTGTWKNCSAATTGYQSDTLVVQGVTGKTYRDGYQYRCVISVGSCYQITTNPATLSVLSPRMILAPQSCEVVSADYAAFQVSAEGTDLTYQWQYQKPGGAWTDCTQATQGYRSNTLTVQGLTGKTNRSGYQYRCIVTDAYGGRTVSDAATLSVVVPAIQTQPENAAVSPSAYAAFTVSAVGTDLRYQWQYKTPSGTWKNCSAATKGFDTAALQVQGATGSTNRNGYQYRCKVTDAAGTVVTSASAKLTVS